jgi:DNA modification methylase
MFAAPARTVIKRNNTQIRNFAEQYAKTTDPIEVNFRELVPEIVSADRLTHLIHTYPAKLLVHIPFFFINNSIFSKPGDFILDPFCGSGTVLLESAVAGRIGLGADANPLARLISQVKVTKVNIKSARSELLLLIKKAKRFKSIGTADVVNLDYWFPEHVSISLSRLLRAINAIKNENLRRFMLVSFSNCVKKVSYADQNVSVPVKLNPKRYESYSTRRREVNARLKELKSVDVFERFQAIATANIDRFERTNGALANGTASLIAHDARSLVKSPVSPNALPNNSVQLIITSPPYAGAQKYIRASSLSLGWTGLARTDELPILDKRIVGRESIRSNKTPIEITGIREADELIRRITPINPVRGAIVARYLIEMQEALIEMVRVLKRGGYVVLIMGNNRVCGEELNTQQYLSDFLTQCGLSLQFKLIEDIRSFGLMTKRNTTADIISREWVLVFKK